MSRIAVIGAGAWGTALAQVYASAGHDVMLWARENALADSIQRTKENATYLPGITLAANIRATSDLEKALKEDIILNVVPAQYMRSILEQMKPYLRPDQPMVLCAKGIEIQSRQLLSDIVREQCSNPVAILTGPSFAIDLVKGKPTAATLACTDKHLAKRIQESLSSKTLRLYTSDDVIGAQIGGAIKNVIAIACGIVGGLDLGESARAALVTRGLAEIARLTVALGGKRETLMGQCGVGDLMLTCSSQQSRNFSFGYLMGQGQSAEEILSQRKSVTEGVTTAKAAVQLAKDFDVDMPITESVHACIEGRMSISDALTEIMERPARGELT
ncbi:MAG: glycerol-3-phosphate acyltransferase [Micavibrio aeruginosavorus]|uniref:Glycerol-3-phosphate dehydrogenase [NAD(P)+] n=1 Tax=Micavibrio aeruginosavorus TaxID=349221 RepID=A0A2W5FRV9_9BACT|nr:MAG: glycerol-3-phosphate acyltransferase [Micavibrio aeruginosavorus]